jgi:hypothetical protein
MRREVTRTTGVRTRASLTSGAASGATVLAAGISLVRIVIVVEV